MFKVKEELDSNIDLAVTVEIIFDNPPHLPKGISDSNETYDRVSRNYKIKTINDINRYYPFINGTPKCYPPGQILLTVTGSLFGKAIDQRFLNLAAFDYFLLEHGLFPASKDESTSCSLF